MLPEVNGRMSRHLATSPRDIVVQYEFRSVLPRQLQNSEYGISRVTSSSLVFNLAALPACMCANENEKMMKRSAISCLPSGTFGGEGGGVIQNEVELYEVSDYSSRKHST